MDSYESIHGHILKNILDQNCKKLVLIFGSYWKVYIEILLH